jgi:hypothetical protein
MALSRLSDENKELAQRFALMDWHNHELESKLEALQDRESGERSS